MGTASCHKPKEDSSSECEDMERWLLVEPAAVAPLVLP